MAKGRVEQVHQTLQDQLVTELRVAGISDSAAANALLPAFMLKISELQIPDGLGTPSGGGR